MDTYNWESPDTSVVGPKLPPQKVNVLDTTALQYPVEYIMQKINKRKPAYIPPGSEETETDTLPEF
jgi:hypothetical protein